MPADFALRSERVWAEPFVTLRLPKLYNLRTDPYERADITSNSYWDWVLDNACLVLAATAILSRFLETFPEFPPRQKAASFTIDSALEKLQAAITSGRQTGYNRLLPKAAVATGEVT